MIFFSDGMWMFQYPPKTLPPLPPPLYKSKMVTYFLLLISAFQSSLMSRVHPSITFPERIWCLKSLAFPYNDRFSIFLVWIERCYGSYKYFQNKELSNNCTRGTTYGIWPLLRVLFLSLILSSFQIIILPFSYADKRGWDSAHPAFSCKEILDSGHSKGDGEYWIDPEKSGSPLKVYCDMSRYGGKRMNLFFETRGLQQEYILLRAVVIGTFWS